MNRYFKELAILDFLGGRFENHNLPVDALGELITLQKILEDFSSEIYLRKNPGLTKPPNNFKDLAKIHIQSLRPGSVSLTMALRTCEAFQLHLFEDVIDYTKTAFLKILETLKAIIEEKKIPEGISRKIFFELKHIGKSLFLDEKLRLRAPGTSPVEVTPEIRKKILSLSRENYEDIFDISGTIFEVDLRGNTFRIFSRDEKPIKVSFPPERESEILNAFVNHRTTQIRITGTGKFSMEGILKRIINIENLDIVQLKAEEKPPQTMSLWDEFAEITRDIPDEAWSVLPSDYSSNLDLYLYGSSRHDK